MEFKVFTKSEHPEITGQNEEVAVYMPDNCTTKTPVIFALHGNWATYRRFENYGNFFSARGFLVIAPTYRHHYRGNETNPELGKTSVRDYADDVAYLIRNLQMEGSRNAFHPFPKNTIIIGHSMGGLIAQLVSLKIPLKGLILLNSAPPAGIKLHLTRDYQEKIKELRKPIIFGEPYLPNPKVISEYIYNGMPREIHEKLYSGAVYESGTASREILAGSGEWLPKYLAWFLSKPIKINSTKINCPKLVIGCAKDKIIVPQIARDIHQKFKSKTPKHSWIDLKIFDEFAHWPQMEPNWEISAEFIHDWINKHIHLHK